jgi:transcriptional regulator with PAS, ATPase and Fis domain
LANNGTLLLDEIGDMPMNLQVKLLRVLQEGVIDRIGSVKSIPINVRLICATNSNLQKKVEERTFREDLYYRINVVEINIPPLRSHIEDLPFLIDFFIKKVNSDEGLNILGIEPEALNKLGDYVWKGNIRELKHVIQRASVHRKSGMLLISDFDFFNKKFENQALIIDNSLKERLSDVEKNVIIEALSLYKGNKSKAAKHLNMDRSMLYKKLKRYQMM